MQRSGGPQDPVTAAVSERGLPDRAVRRRVPGDGIQNVTWPTVPNRTDEPDPQRPLVLGTRQTSEGPAAP